MVQPLKADGVCSAGSLAFAVGGAAVVDVGFVGILVRLFDQCVTAVGAFEQTRKEVDVPALYSPFYTFIQHFLHPLKVILVDDRLVRTLDDDPLVGRAGADALGFVVDLAAFALHHVADVHLVLQGAADGFVAPEGRVADGAGFEIHALIALVGRGIRDAALVEMSHDPADSRAAQIHPVDLSDDLGGFLVDDQLVVIGGVFFVAVFGEGADEFASPALHVERGADALGVGGDIVFVDHSAHGIVEKVNCRALTLAGVDQVVDGNVSDSELRENLADISSALRGVSAEAGAVLDDDAVDLARVDVSHHPEESGTIKGRARVAIVDISIGKLNIRLGVDEVFKDPLLVDDGVRLRLVAVLAGQSDVEGGVVGSQLHGLVELVLIHFFLLSFFMVSPCLLDCHGSVEPRNDTVSSTWS